MWEHLRFSNRLLQFNSRNILYLLKCKVGNHDLGVKRLKYTFPSSLMTIKVNLNLSEKENRTPNRGAFIPITAKVLINGKSIWLKFVKFTYILKKGKC